MNANELTTGRFGAGNLSTGKSPTVQPPFKKGECDIQIIEERSAYLPYGKKYAEQFSIQIVWTLEQALKMRADGYTAITIREADIAARGKIPLSKEFLHKAMQAIGGFLTEGLPGEAGNPFYLREFYNRGIEFKRVHWDKASETQRTAAEAAMQDALQKLTDQQLPAWPEEIQNGFAVELTKPEFMDFSQYGVAKRQEVFRI